MPPNLSSVEIPPRSPTLDDLLRTCPELKREDVQHLQDWIEKQPHLPSISDEHLVTFLNACYYSLERAKVMIDKHYTIRTHAPDLFSNVDVLSPAIQNQLKLFEMATLRWKTPLGYWVSASRALPHVSASEFIFDVDIKISLMAIDVMNRLDPVSPGHILILDSAGITMAHAARAGIGTIRKLFTYAQGALNLRLKEIHVIHVTPIIDHIMGIVKPFLGKELAEMLHFHSGEMEGFYKQFPKEILPKEFGGTCLNMASYHDYAIQRITENREWLLSQATLRVDENRRPGRATSAEDLFGMEGSFKRLEID
ncbi:alpha-tocopherol transfer protein-like isoform X1 [Anabrus simplex]|uniref:alpha-tocopherol transfer protein-like isoform X1 n=1 Tax=Anabrus simplex TaxID=316456 RepID=UPI0035A3A618